MVKWEKRKLETLMRIETGSRNTEHKNDGGHYPFFVRSQTVEHIDDYAYDCEAVLTAGDGVGTGKVFHYIIGKFDAHQRVYVMSQFNGIDGKYFYHFFSENFYGEVSKYTAKSSVDSVRRAMIAEMEIPLPPLAEQRRIAEVLSEMDELISATEKLIAKKRNIKQGAMQDLLTGKRRLVGFAGEWAQTKLGKIVELFNNLRLPVTASLREAGQTPYYGANGIQDYINGYTHDGEFVLLAEDGANDLSNYPINYVCGQIWVNNHAHVIKGIEGITITRYIAYALKIVDFQSVLVGGTRAKLNSSVLREIDITIPRTTKEQSAIAAILSDMDAEIDALTEKLSKLKKLKSGMMSELLTGNIRLVEQNAEFAQDVIITEKPEPKKSEPKIAAHGHNQQFDDAVMIAGIVDVLYSDKYTVGRKRVQKCLYLLRRFQDESTAAFKKKAAGPYADEIRYKGGEPIAQRTKYIATKMVKDKGTTFARGNEIDKALVYIQNWGKQSDIKWVEDKLKYKKTDDLELLATVDMAICDLTEIGISISVDSIKHLIATNDEWKAKLKKQTFSDANIAHAICELQTLLQGGN